MNDRTLRVQGRVVESWQLEQIRSVIARERSWCRSQLSRFLCEAWGWKDELGRPKDMACRTLLVKLESAGLIDLPARRVPGRGSRMRVGSVEHATDAIECSLGELGGVRLVDARSSRDHSRLFAHLLAKYHYLGFRDVGRNMKYLALDGSQRPLACVLFGSAAWKVAPRDSFIGWDASTRSSNLQRITNNTRFLIVPWVRVYNLASFVLARSLDRLADDWLSRYGSSLLLVETFVDRSRFDGACYRAANWIRVGKTQGRSRQDRWSTLHVPEKDIYVYPLRPDFRTGLVS